MQRVFSWIQRFGVNQCILFCCFFSFLVPNLVIAQNSMGWNEDLEIIMKEYYEFNESIEFTVRNTGEETIFLNTQKEADGLGCNALGFALKRDLASVPNLPLALLHPEEDCDGSSVVSLAPQETKTLFVWDQQEYYLGFGEYAQTHAGPGKYYVELFSTLESDPTPKATPRHYFGIGVSLDEEIANLRASMITPDVVSSTDTMTAILRLGLLSENWSVKEIREFRTIEDPFALSETSLERQVEQVFLVPIIENRFGSDEDVYQDVSVSVDYEISPSLAQEAYIHILNGRNGSVSHAKVLNEKEGFVDISSDYWAYPYISELYQAGIIHGVSDIDGRQSFYPELDITKAEVTKIALNAAKHVKIIDPLQGLDSGAASSSLSPFQDISHRDSLFREIQEAYNLGLLERTEYFYPNEPATRTFALQVLLRAFHWNADYHLFNGVQAPYSLDMVEATPQSFPDVVDLEDRRFTDWAFDKGIISGNEGLFLGSSSIRRSELAKIASNMIEFFSNQAMN